MPLLGIVIARPGVTVNCNTLGPTGVGGAVGGATTELAVLVAGVERTGVDAPGAGVSGVDAGGGTTPFTGGCCPAGTFVAEECFAGAVETGCVVAGTFPAGVTVLTVAGFAAECVLAMTSTVPATTAAASTATTTASTRVRRVGPAGWVASIVMSSPARTSVRGSAATLPSRPSVAATRASSPARVATIVARAGLQVTCRVTARVADRHRLLHG